MNKEKYKPIEVHLKLRDSKNVDSLLTAHINNALAHCPKEVVNYVAKKCEFISCNRTGTPFAAFLKDFIELGVDYFIFLPCNMLQINENKRKEFILHEVAHTYLRHNGRNIKQEDNEADELVKKWLSENAENNNQSKK